MATQYETNLVSQYGSGMQDYINSQRSLGKSGLLKGSNVDAQDVAGLISGYNSSSYNASSVPSLSNLASQQFQFDPNQYLPGIQQTAASIYDPQQAQIDALAKLSQSQYEQSKATTQEEFNKEMQSTIEAINARGAFFGGGAINRQADVAKRETAAVNALTLQNQASQAGYLAQKAGLSAAQAQYVQEQLTGAYNSAYSRWNDNRNFLLSLNTQQRQQLESDRQFAEDVRQFGLSYALDKKRLSKSS